MGSKDVTEKTLESFNDVFADIVNVLLFNGERIVQEDELADALPRSHYKADGKIREQERDTAKYWRKMNICIAMMGLENETKPNNFEPIRVFSYDGSAYRAQLNDTDEKGKPKHLYPVVTLVLYFGSYHWHKPKTLFEALKVPDLLRSFMNDYKINLVEVSFLEDETIQKFQSDFGIVADYFAQSRKNKDYIPTTKTIQHVNEVMELMSVITGDNRYVEAINSSFKGGNSTMSCVILDRIENKGIEKGIEKGILKSINSLMETMGWNADTAMNALEIPKEEQEHYLSLL